VTWSEHAELIVVGLLAAVLVTLGILGLIVVRVLEWWHRKRKPPS